MCGLTIELVDRLCRERVIVARSAARAVGLFIVKQKTACDMRISDWSSDVCSSDLALLHMRHHRLDLVRGADDLDLLIAFGLQDFGVARIGEHVAEPLDRKSVV